MMSARLLMLLAVLLAGPAAALQAPAPVYRPFMAPEWISTQPPREALDIAMGRIAPDVTGSRLVASSGSDYTAEFYVRPYASTQNGICRGDVIMAQLPRRSTTAPGDWLLSGYQMRHKVVGRPDADLAQTSERCRGLNTADFFVSENNDNVMDVRLAQQLVVALENPQRRAAVEVSCSGGPGCPPTGPSALASLNYMQIGGVGFCRDRRLDCLRVTIRTSPGAYGDGWKYDIDYRGIEPLRVSIIVPPPPPN